MIILSLSSSSCPSITAWVFDVCISVHRFVCLPVCLPACLFVSTCLSSLNLSFSSYYSIPSSSTSTLLISLPSVCVLHSYPHPHPTPLIPSILLPSMGHRSSVHGGRAQVTHALGKVPAHQETNHRSRWLHPKLRGPEGGRLCQTGEPAAAVAIETCK